MSTVPTIADVIRKPNGTFDHVHVTQGCNELYLSEMEMRTLVVRLNECIEIAVADRKRTQPPQERRGWNPNVDPA